MNPARILYVNPFAHAVSGADESLLTILNHLDRNSFLPFLVLPLKSPYSARFRNLGVSVCPFLLLRLKRTKNPFYWILYAFWSPIEILFFILYLTVRRIDLVHLNMEASLSAAIAAKILQRKVVLHYRGKTGDEPKWFFDRFFPVLESISDQIFCISYANSQGFRKRGLTKKIQVLYNAVNLKNFENSKDKSLLTTLFPELKDRTILLFVGRMDPQKRIDDLIRASKELTDFKDTHAVVIVGGDLEIEAEVRHRNWLMERARSNHDSMPIFFLERDTRVPEIMSSADFLVLPSVGEGFGRVVIEAMAAGTPVIVARSGALPEIIKDGEFGYICEPKNPQSLAETIQRAIEDSERMNLVKRARDYAQNTFNIESHVRTLEQSYRGLLRISPVSKT